MSTPYAGNPANYPTSIQQPSDGEWRSASATNVPDAALADRTAFLKAKSDAFSVAIDKARYLNWPSGVNTPLVGRLSSFQPIPAAYDAKNGKLILAGYVTGGGSDPSMVLVSDGGAMGAPSINLLSAWTGDPLYAPSAVACDEAGNVVVSTSGRYVFDLAVANIGVTNRRDAFGAAVTLGASSVIFNPVTGYWILVAASNVSAVPVCRQSVNRSTWTAVANALATAAVYTCIDLGVSPAGLVVCAALAGSTIRIARTSNNGSSWSTELAITTAVASASNVQLSHDATRGLWLLVVGSAIGISTSELWTSPDAITWTKKTTTVNAALGKIAVDEFGVYVTCFTTNSVSSNNLGPALSLDGGTTWLRIGLQPPPINGHQPSRSFFTGTGFVCVTGQSAALYAMFSMRTGNPTLTQVT